MPYLNNHFHVYDVHKNIPFQIVGKTNFINWLNAYTADRLVDYGRYKYFIKTGPQAPVYVAVGQNGRMKITGGEDLVWFAKKSGLEQLPVFFSYQRQV